MANTKVSVKQDCVYEGPQQRNLKQINHMHYAISY